MNAGATMNKNLPELHAVIGVRFKDGLTYYVQRSNKMENYPSVWSLLSIQFDPKELPDPKDLTRVQIFMKKMSDERLGGVSIHTKNHLISGDTTDNPFDKHVYLHLYEVELPKEPVLNPDYYSDAEWLTAEEYEERSANQRCGLCLRLWSDYAWMAGVTDRPFVPRAVGYHD